MSIRRTIRAALSRWLTRHCEPTGPRFARPEPPAEAAFRGTILVVEDDSFVRSGIEMLLAAEGLNVVGAASGHEALELVTAKQVRPELILSDFNLPGRMNGVETIQAVRKALAENIPAIVLTGDIRTEVLDAIALHDVRIATKPVNADQLLALVRQHHAQAAAE